MLLKTTLTVLTFGLSTLAFAGPGHSDDHGDNDQASFAAGQPGTEHAVNRVIRVEASDRMRFNPDDWAIQPGETVRFVVANSGQMPHEFVIDTVQGNAKHRDAMMDAMAEGGMMEHNDPNAVSVAPGETGELIWTFSEKGTFEAACNIPGHYEAGMNARIEVSKETLAQNH
ncbi:cupredoxin domain-containing protein [Saccharospirillum salsuginis]|uniref:Copper oxidase n=1 Tax=Saccharospirillum salsuginis TaxID=418750 RepID=A0A918K550_9GAMM|nr:cupredoxin family protein [Saccharospirillum salsuginis]GGX48563.1 copper oxidase [Saccharospirillum salsuginis]